MQREEIGERCGSVGLNAVEEPIFLVGAERSGTSVLRLMLDHHPKLAFAKEFEYAVDLVGDDGTLPECERFGPYLAASRIFADSGFEADESLDYAALVRSFLRQKLTSDDKMQVGATVHRHFDRLLYLWPRARFIHLLRDPRDVARSTIPMGWAGNTWTAAQRWIDAEECWERMLLSAPGIPKHEVRYEDLMRDAETELDRVCQFVGTQFHPAMLRYPQTSSYGPPDAGLCEQWRQKLTDREVQLVEARTGRLLRERGYEVSGLPSLLVGPWLERRLRLHDWGVRLRFRIRRFGFPLVALEFLLRRTGQSNLHRGIMARMNQIVARHLR